MNDAPDVFALAKGLRVPVTAGASGVERAICAGSDVAFVISMARAAKA
jgi:hypothetical protein